MKVGLRVERSGDWRVEQLVEWMAVMMAEK